MKDPIEESDHQILTRLAELRSVRSRDPQQARRARAVFLGQAVSLAEARSLKGWTSIFKKERYAMNILVKILIVMGLALGGTATVQAARDDLPNQPLYAVKTWAEGVSLEFEAPGEARADRLMALSQTRVQEMLSLAAAGEPIPAQVRTRLESHVQDALQICLTLDEPALDRTLLQLRDQLRLQDQALDQMRLRLHTQPQSQAQEQLLTQTRSMLQERLRLVEEGLANHEQFRERVRNGFHFGPDAVTPPAAGNGNGPHGQPTQVSNATQTGPGSPNVGPGRPTDDPAGVGFGSGGPNPDPAGSQLTPTGPNPDPAGNGNMNGPGGAGGNDAGGTETRNNMGGADTGSGTGGSGSGGGGPNGGGGSGGGGGGNRP